MNSREAFEQFAIKELGITARGGSPGWRIWQAALEWQAARESEPAWTDRLNACTHHGDDHEACAKYSGQVPCDVESEGGEAVGYTWDAGRFGQQFTQDVQIAEKLKNEGVDVVPVYARPVKQQSEDYLGWYCAHCKRGVDGSEVTFNEQHTECGRVITNDVPPPPQPDKWIRITEDCARMSIEALEKFTRDIRNGATGDPEPIEHYYGMQAIDELTNALPTPPEQESE